MQSEQPLWQVLLQAASIFSFLGTLVNVAVTNRKNRDDSQAKFRDQLMARVDQLNKEVTSLTASLSEMTTLYHGQLHRNSELVELIDQLDAKLEQLEKVNKELRTMIQQMRGESWQETQES